MSLPGVDGNARASVDPLPDPRDHELGPAEPVEPRIDYLNEVAVDSVPESGRTGDRAARDTLAAAKGDSTRAPIRQNAAQKDGTNLPAKTSTRDANSTGERTRYMSRDSVRVQLASDSLLSALPGEILTAVFVVRNDGGRTRTLTPRVEPPDGWYLIMAPSQVTLGSGRGALQLAALRIPAAANAGDFVFRVSFQDSSGVDLASAEVLITVETVRTITLRLGRLPQFVAAGDPYEVPITVMNSGNVDVDVHLRVRPGGNEYVVLDKSRDLLAPGETSQMVAKVETDDKLSKAASSTFRVSAWIEGYPDSRVTASSVVEVVPVYGPLQPAAEPLETLLTLGAVGDDHNRGIFLSAEGAGEVLGGQFDFDARFPDRRDVTRFGRRDSYKASYRSKSLDLAVGDQAFTLSPLTTKGDYAFGAAASVRTGWAEVKALSQRSRYSVFDNSLHGAGVEFHPDASSGIGLNVLTRDGIYEGTITTIRGEFSPFAGSSVSLECGVDNIDGFENPSCVASLAGAERGLQYHGQFFRAGENYPGYSSGLTQGSAGFQWRLAPEWTVRTDLDALEKEGASDLTRNRFTSLTGLGYRGRYGATVVNGEFQVITSSTNYRGRAVELDRNEQTLRLSASLHRSVASVNARVDVGRARSDAQRYDGGVRREQLGIQLQPVRAVDVSAFFEHVTGFASSLPQSVKRWFSGLQAMWRPVGRTRLQAGLTRSLDVGVTERTYTSVDARVDFELPWRHRLSAHLRRSVDDGRSKGTYNDYRFGYTVPVNVPLPNTSRRPRNVHGKVFDDETGQAIPGVLIHFGDRMTLTDKHGRFRFPIEPLETRHLQVNQRSIGLDRVALVPTPVPIPAGQFDVEIDIPVSVGAVLSGSLKRYDFVGNTVMAAGDSAGIEAGVQGAIVEIRSIDNVFRVRTNEHGSFTLRNIPAGSYDVAIVQARISAQHRWASESMRITLAPGESRELAFKLMPIRRTIRRIDGGAVRPSPGSSH